MSSTRLILLSLLVSQCILITAHTSRAQTTAAARPNVLLICVDDLRPELKSFGKQYIHSPQIDALAASGRAFHRHYVNAPSCGPSRYTLLTGRYGKYGNDALMKRASLLNTGQNSVTPSLPEWFRKHGYTTVALGKVSHHPGGLGGAGWNDPAMVEMPGAWNRNLMPSGPWGNPLGAMHGLADGEVRRKAGDMDVYQAVAGSDSIYPDGLITEAAIQQLDLLTATPNQPFFFAVGLIRPHLPFGAPQQYLDLYEGVTLPPIPHPAKPTTKSTWHGSGEFMKYNRWGKNPNKDAAFADEVRRHYAACVSYADAQIGKIIEKLKQTGVYDNTVIVLWGDHGWHLGEYSIWGKHSLFEESLHSPLIIVSPGMNQPGTPSQAVVETTDIFPTLCELTATPLPGFLVGTSLVPQLNDPEIKGHIAIAYKHKIRTIRNHFHRLILYPDGQFELYDMASGEYRLIEKEYADPQIIKALKEQLTQQLNTQ
ncbi:MAG: sulfatase [Verrucomicrobiota bacterium]